jgi:hypothetical protein
MYLFIHLKRKTRDSEMVALERLCVAYNKISLSWAWTNAAVSVTFAMLVRLVSVPCHPVPIHEVRNLQFQYM